MIQIPIVFDHQGSSHKNSIAPRALNIKIKDLTSIRRDVFALLQQYLVLCPNQETWREMNGTDSTQSIVPLFTAFFLPYPLSPPQASKCIPFSIPKENSDQHQFSAIPLFFQ